MKLKDISAGPDWVVWIAFIVFAVFSIVLLLGRGSWLISGYIFQYNGKVKESAEAPSFLNQRILISVPQDAPESLSASP